jgi:aerotaxis receptor
MGKVTPIDEEYIYDGSVIISQTNLQGEISYVNKMFCEVSAYKSEEIIGEPHNILRDPDMPRAVFEKMWQTITAGQAWNGLIKNLRKDGLYYWVDTEILPIQNQDEEITGYIAASKPASRKNISEVQENYTKMLELED